MQRHELPAEPARSYDAAYVAVLTMIISAAGAARPSLWFDEAATISASTRTVPELWRMLGNIDAVHGLYYLIMHGWMAVFPVTEFWTRASSSLTAGAAAAGVVVLGRRLSSRPVAVTAGLFFAVLPRVTWAGIETRSYALTMVAGVWLTVFLLAVLRRNRPSWWCGYALLLITATLLNVFMVLLVPVHAVMVVVMTSSWQLRLRWVAAAAAASIAVTPFMLFSQTQLFQVGWISPVGMHTFGEVLREQYFDDALVFAIVAGIVIVVGVLCLSVGRASAGPEPYRLLAITAAWILLPTAALLTYSAVHKPIYYPRYLSFTTPGIALLIGMCVVAIARSPRISAAILAIFTAAAIPNYLAQRSAYAKERMDYSQVADVITQYAKPGDCLVMDNSATWKPGPIRPLIAARRAAFAKLHDYGLGQPAVARNMLWDSHSAIWTWSDKLPDCSTLWTVSERDATLSDHQRGDRLPPGPRMARAMAYQVPSRFGFHVVERWQFSFAQVTKSIK
jgi:mannosyltransferase